jgi:hypothetical protein
MRRGQVQILELCNEANKIRGKVAISQGRGLTVPGGRIYANEDLSLWLNDQCVSVTIGNLVTDGAEVVIESPGGRIVLFARNWPGDPSLIVGEPNDRSRLVLYFGGAPLTRAAVPSANGQPCAFRIIGEPMGLRERRSSF